MMTQIPPFFALTSLFIFSSLTSYATPGLNSIVIPPTQAQMDAFNGPRLIQIREDHAEWMTPDQITRIAHQNHARGRCGGFMDVTDHPVQKKLYLEPMGVLDGRLPAQQALVERLLPELSETNLTKTIERLSQFHNRYYQSDTGVEAAQWLKSQYESIAVNRTDVKVSVFNHRFKQPSVIARIEGTGPHKDEIIVLGAHLDSINWSAGWPTPGERSPGADDDASGTATVLEIFRVLIQSGIQFDRSIEFMGYAGEERGLLGSQDIAQSYQTAAKKVVAVFHLDMTFFPGDGMTIHFISDNTHRELTTFTEQLVDTYVKIPWKETACGYACSDHASWNNLGFPAVYPFEATDDHYNQKIHSTSDTLAILNSTFGLSFAKLGLAFALEMHTDSH